MNPSSKDPAQGCSSQTPEAGLASGITPYDAVQDHVNHYNVRRFQGARRGGHLDLPESLPNTRKNEALDTAMPPEVTVESPPELDQAFAKYGKIVTLQDRFLMDQTRLKSERDTAITIFLGLKESISRFVELFAINDGEIGHSSDIGALQVARDQVIADGKAFDNQMSLVIKQEQSLGELEYRLGELLPDLLDVLGSCFPSFQRRGRAQLPRDSSRSRPSTSPAMETMETQYYEKRGDVRLLRDQLFNHSAEIDQLAEGQDTAAFAFTQSSSPLKPTDRSQLPNRQSDASMRWKTEHERMQNNLYIEEKELERLWHVCQDAGIDVGHLSIELPATPRLSAHSSPVEADHDAVELDTPPFLRFGSSGIVSRFFKDFRWPRRGSLVTPTLPSLTDLADKRDFIERWVVKLPDNLLGSRWTEFGHVTADAKEDSDWTKVHRNERRGSSLKEHGSTSGGPATGSSGEGARYRGPRRLLRNWRSDDGLGSQHPSTHDIER